MDAFKGKTTYTRRANIDELKAPNVVYYGDSHIGRLQRWSQYVETNGTFWSLEKKVLSNSRYIYSGGSTWANVHKRVQGVDVPLHQRQGNTLKKVMDEIEKGGYKADYLFVSCFGNDMDQLNDRYYHSVRHSNVWHLLIDTPFRPSEYYQSRYWWDDRLRPPVNPQTFDHRKFVKKEIKTLKSNVNAVVKILKDAFPGIMLYMLGTLVRQNWFPVIRNLVTEMNMHMRLKHRVKVIQINGYLAGQHLESDGTHLTSEGYRLFISKAVGPLLDSYYERIRPKKVRKEFHEMSKAQKKRHLHNMKNKKRNQHVIHVA